LESIYLKYGGGKIVGLFGETCLIRSYKKMIQLIKYFLLNDKNQHHKGYH